MVGEHSMKAIYSNFDQDYDSRDVKIRQPGAGEDVVAEDCKRMT